jgi:ATP/maltotriose-dependent transcriptional regulator MalT
MPVAEAEEEVRRMVLDSRGLVTESSAQRALGRLAAMRGSFEEARDLVQDGRAALAEAGYAVFHASSTQASAEVEELAGNYEAQFAELREGFEQLTRFGEHAFASTNAMMAGWALCKLGRDAEAGPWIDAARDLSPESDVATLAGADYVEAVVLARRGELDAALLLARRAFATAETTDFWHLRADSHEALAEVLSRSERETEARAIRVATLEIFEAKGLVVEAERLRASLAEL